MTSLSLVDMTERMAPTRALARLSAQVAKRAIHPLLRIMRTAGVDVAGPRIYPVVVGVGVGFGARFNPE